MSGHERRDAHGLRGERGLAAVAHVLSIQSRVTHLMAMGLLVVIGFGFLAWYYTHMMSRPARVRQSSQAGLVEKARAEMPLPPLGQFEDLAAGVPASPPAPDVPPDVNSPTPVSPTPVSPTPLQWAPGPVLASRATPLERRLSGVAFAAAGAPASSAGQAPGSAAELNTAMGSTAPSAARSPDALSALLVDEGARAAAARLLPTQRLLLPKGAFIDCTLETAIDSTLPGLTTCVTATDTFSADGKVVLLERGTKLMGETRGQVQQGSARVFVLWTEARTPTGVIVPLDSPGADELGRSGLPGEVERHF